MSHAAQRDSLAEPLELRFAVARCGSFIFQASCGDQSAALLISLDMQTGENK